MNYSLINKLSQARNSIAYSIIQILLSPIYLLLSLIALIFGLIERRLFNKRLQTPPTKLAVVITGCSTGFGYKLAHALSKEGVLVYAGVRREADGEKVKNESTRPENIVPVLSDVTDVEQLKEAAEFVSTHLEENGLQLLALVNNAGYGYYSPIEVADIANYKRMVDVNVYGVVNTTQAFLHVLRKYGSKTLLTPRIINISSGAGQVSMPPTGTYSSSKYALEAITDALRIELKPWNIRVILVEPGRFSTEFQDKAYTEFVCQGIGKITPEIENHYRKIVNSINEESAKMQRPDGKFCVNVIEDALFDTNPLARYLAGVDVQVGLPLVHFLRNEFITDIIFGKKWRSLQK